MGVARDLHCGCIYLILTYEHAASAFLPLTMSLFICLAVGFWNKDFKPRSDVLLIYALYNIHNLNIAFYTVSWSKDSYIMVRG